MIKRPFLLVVLVCLLQCSDKEVMLPVVPEGGIAETQNHSSIWIFYDASGEERARHWGFMSKEDILAKWKELRVTFGPPS